jgi:hypothetical protein
MPLGAVGPDAKRTLGRSSEVRPRRFSYVGLSITGNSDDSSICGKEELKGALDAKAHW